MHARKAPLYCPMQVVGIPGVRVKKTYNTKKEAESKDPKQRAYKCPHCNKWHLTMVNVT